MLYCWPPMSKQIFHMEKMSWTSKLCTSGIVNNLEINQQSTQRFMEQMPNLSPSILKKFTSLGLLHTGNECAFNSLTWREAVTL